MIAFSHSELTAEELAGMDSDHTEVLPTDNFVGEQIEVIQDKTTKVSGQGRKCEWFRQYKIKYNYVGPEHDFIYYTIYQCLNAKKDVTGEKAYFSYKKNGKQLPLPAGCPPPVVTPPPKEDECQMGYEVGQVISRTVANIVTPQLLEDDPENPFYDDSVFKKIKELEKKYKDNKTDNP